MGLIQNIKAGLIIAFLAGLFSIGAHATAPNQIEAYSPSTQNYALAAPLDRLARDANTFQTDKGLDAACREAGQEEETCLCIVHILKYDLPLKDYRATLDMFEQTEEITLIARDDFEPRCAQAMAYYNGAYYNG